MDSMPNVADAGLYTDFSDLARLRAKSSSATQSDEATKEVAKQFEALFLQMMLKSMREASIPGGSDGESAESDQTRFYQEMFDKQIAMELVNKNNGNGIGLASMLEQEFSGNKNAAVKTTALDSVELIRQQVNRSSASINQKQNSGQE